MNQIISNIDLNDKKIEAIKKESSQQLQKLSEDKIEQENLIKNLQSEINKTNERIEKNDIKIVAIKGE